MGKYAKNQSKGKFVAFQMGKVINAQFPTLYERAESLVDPRKHREYVLAELVFGGIAIFMFKFGSLNQFDNYRKESVFKKNFYRTFKMRLPSSDAIEDLMRLLELLPPSPGNVRERILAEKGILRKQTYSWVNGLDYNGFTLSVITCEETCRPIKKKESGQSETRVFRHITNMDIDWGNSIAISDSGRLRWAIENSFDYLKNHGYNLGHKFSRVSFTAYKNYYQCMMIAHMISQFLEKSSDFVELRSAYPKNGILFLWQRLISFFSEFHIETAEFELHVKRRTQIRLA